jgi:F-type H+-transporting ATPase subunit b
MHFDLWTLALQTINVVILVWLLSRFLYRPLLAVVDGRRAEIRKVEDDAERARQEATGLRAEAAAAATATAAERQQLIAQAQAIARREAEAELAKASEQIRKLEEDAAAGIAKARHAAEAELTETANTLAIDIARRLLRRLPADVTFAGFLDGLCKEARELPPQLRDGFRGEVALVSPAALGPEALARARTALETAFGFPLALTPQVDATLLAGLELRAALAVVSNTWKADLDQIAKDLRRDSRHPDSPVGLAQPIASDR